MKLFSKQFRQFRKYIQNSKHALSSVLEFKIQKFLFIFFNSENRKSNTLTETRKKILNVIISICLFFFLIPSTFADEDRDNMYLSFRWHCPPDQESCEDGEIPIPENKNYQDASGITLGEERKIDLFIQNPKTEMITSIKAKLKYDPTKMQISGVDIENSDFPLPEPMSNKVNKKEGTVDIGLTFVRGSQNDSEFYVMTLAITPIVEGARLEFLNYQKTELGDTLVLFTSGIDSKNVLQQEPYPIVFSSSTNAVAPEPTETPPVATPAEEAPEEAPEEEAEVILHSDELPRPTDLKVQTSLDGKVKLVWPLGADSRIKGYYLYYSQNSGFYLRRKDVGKTNYVEIPDFPKQQKYFFAITAYDALDKESDYSDEVSVTIGKPGSESHRFLGDPRNPGSINVEPETSTQKSKNTPKTSVISSNISGNVDELDGTGPEHIFFILVVSMGVALLFFAFRATKKSI